MGSKIALGLHVLDTWSVFSVPYVGDGFKYSDWTVHTGHVVSVVCYVCGWYVQI